MQIENKMNNNRIEFIDLAKGICIILVVIGHCGVNVSIPGLEIVRMPLYFILSGLFFKTYGSYINFTIKKTNKILIPFLFFYLIAYIIYYALLFLTPQLLITEATGIFDIFNNRQLFNGPIWFLLVLYWCGLIFAGICILFKREIIRVCLVLLIGSIGLYLGHKNILLPMFIGVACTALPFYCFGYYLKRTPLLYANKYDKYNIIYAIILYISSYFVSTIGWYRLAFLHNKVENIQLTYPLAILSVLCILIVCKSIKSLPIISYFGRYSIIILCTHHLIYRPLKVLFNMSSYEFMHSPWLLSIATLICCWILIPICLKLIPYFVAQKDLIKWKNT